MRYRYIHASLLLASSVSFVQNPRTERTFEQKFVTMEKVSAASAMDWSIKLEKSLRSKNPVKAIEAILEIGEKLEQWSKEPEPEIAVYTLFDLIPEEDRLFSNTILLRLVNSLCYGDKLVKLAVVRVFISLFKLSRGKNKSECATWFLSKAKVRSSLFAAACFCEVADDSAVSLRPFLSDNVLATSVVVNSTITNAKHPSKHVFHIVTDKLNYAAMRMWFLDNPPWKATFQVSNVEEFILKAIGCNTLGPFI